MKYALLFSAVIIAIAGQLLLKKGVSSSQLFLSLDAIIKTVFSPWVFTGFILYGLGSIIWLFVLQRFPLSVAYPTMAISYVVIVIISRIFLHEPLTLQKTLGVACIVFGIILLSYQR